MRDVLFEGQKDKVLNKQEFFKLLKFISALQNGYNIDDVSIQDLPGTEFLLFQLNSDRITCPKVTKEKCKRNYERE